MSDQEDDAAEHATPSVVAPERAPFDRFADRASGVVSEGPFFAICAALFTAWVVAGVLTGFDHPWVDLLVSSAGIATVLMVALVENEQRRSDQAIQRKLNAIADALADFMAQQEVDQHQVDELRAAIGLEQRESTRSI
ncbi:MAG TPA: low affinity iron permease family protein [Acidimicrobiales bacterium]|nr:low affinity iron permease family protein [Acidimicrobiales bacterium]